MRAPQKPLSPAEIAALEHAFSSDPSSGAWRALTEAYVSMGRFMEAMVVCKKGVKANPADASARLLLAEVYAAQGKDRKALDELVDAQRAHPDDAAVNRMSGLLLLKLGEKDAGVAALQKAALARPDDPETLEALRKWGIPLPQPRPPPPPPRAPEPPPLAPTPAPVAAPAPRGAPPVLARAGASASSGAAVPRAPVVPRAPAPVAEAEPTPEPLSVPVVEAEPTPEPLPAPASHRPSAAARRHAPRNEAYADHLAEKYNTEEWQIRHRPPPRKSARRAVVGTVVLFIALVSVLGGWWGVSSWKKRQAVEIDRLLKQTRELLEKDAYASYKEAGKLCERILERDPDSLGGRSYLAYVDALAWGEHGEPEGRREEAKKQVAQAKKLGQIHSHLLAAEAYLQYYGGDTKGAADGLQRFLTGNEGGTSALLHGTLGIIQMQAGDLDGARESLMLAQKFAPGDVRIVQRLAELYRRRGAGFELQAWTLYEVVLQRLSKDHVPSMLGQATLLMEREQPEGAVKLVDRVLAMGENASPRQVAMAHAIKGSALFALGRAGDAAAAEQQALTLDPSNPDILELIGKRKLRSGDWQGAAESFQKALQIDAVRVSFVKQLGDAYRLGGDAERALAQYQKAVQMAPKAVDARIARARVWRERRDWQKSLEELDQAQKALGAGGTGTGLSQVTVETAEVQEASGAKFELVRDLYVKALKADGANCPALFWLGRQAFEQKRPDDAKPLIADYLRLCPRGPRAADAQKMQTALR